MMKMHKALKSLATGYTLFQMYISPVVAALFPVYMIFGRRDNIVALLSFCGLISLFLVLMWTGAVFPVTGSTPAIPKTMKWAANTRNMLGGSGGCYDMACLFPTTRKQLIMPHIKVWFPLLIIIAAETAAAVIFNYGGECRGMISAFSLCFALIAIGVPNVYYYKPKNQFIALAMIIAAWIILLVSLMVSGVLDTEITIALPAPAAILLPMGAVVVNAIFYNVTALRGDFARNGEKVS